MVIVKKLGELKIFLLDSVYGLSEIQIFDYGKRRNEELEAVNRNINRSIHQLAYHRQLVVSTPTFSFILLELL